MPTTNIDYAAALDIAHYIVPMRMAAITLEDAATAAANSGASLSTWLNTANAISGPATVSASGANATFEILVNSASRTITNVALASNVVTITTSAAHGLAVGDRVRVAATTATAVNGTVAVKAAPTTTTFTYDLTGSNITSAADTGTVTTGVYPLDGAGKPIQLLNVTGAPLSTQTNDESVITHDQVTRGSSISIGINDTHTIAFKGMTVHRSVDHKIMEILRQFSVAEKLAVKYLRVGPGGTTEKKLCYGRISSKQEEGDAGALVKYGASLNVLGATYTIFDNTAA
ncbi:MAG: hypothetical protein KGO47_08635 [Cyanobacteria bacterium REEB417]|nr:hypothetical protein [Cyanobacteria bacterium REEB417]